jgi:hypothetical protein
MNRPSIPVLPVRLLIYFLVQGVILAVYAEATMQADEDELAGIDLKELLKENAILEWAQAGLLAVIVTLGLGAFRRGEPVIHRVLVLMAAFAMFRELDSFLKDLLFKRSHHIFMGLIFWGAAAVVWRRREEFVGQLAGFLGRPGFPFMFFGVVLVVLFGQILGQRDIWKALAPDKVSLAKRFVEEGLEFMGYVSIAIGFVEERFVSGRKANLNPHAPNVERKTEA